MRGVRGRRLLAAAVLVVGLVLSALATRYVHGNLRRAAGSRFAQRTDQAVQELVKRMEAYEATIRSTSALFAASQEVTPAEFRRFVESIDPATNYPGIQGIGYAALLHGTPEERERELEQMLAGPPMQPPPPGGRTSAVVILEPLDVRNREALGYDMFAEPTRRAAMERARDSGQPAATGKVELVQEITADKQAGFLIYVPVYAGAEPPETVAERRGRLVGWVYSPFRMRDLLSGVFAGAVPFGFSVYDGGGVDEGRLLFRSGAPAAEGELVIVRRMDVAGEVWTLVFHTPPGEPGTSVLPPIVLLSSALITVLIFAIVWSQVVGREAAERYSAQLVESEAERTRLLEAERASRHEAERERQRAAFLADATTMLASTLDASDLLERIARRSLALLGDGCAVDLADAAGALHRAVLVYREPGREAFLRESALVDEAVGPTIRGVSATGEAVLVPEVTAAMIEQRVQEPLRAAAGDVMRSFLCVPLPSRYGPIGAMSFVSAQPGRFGAEDRDLAFDLARRVALALENTRLYAGAQEAVRVRDEFLSIASHELRTPLTALQAHLQGLLRSLHRTEGPVDRERLEDKLGTALRQTRRLGKLVGELLDVARITAGQLQVEREPFDLAELAAEIAERFRAEALRAGCEIAVRANAGVTGRWDRHQMEQVITNLLSNAVKYGAGQPVDLEVGLRGDVATLTVRDRGIGIPPEAQARIFGRFERASSERHYGGLGLGLYITREIVNAHGGRIAVRSEPGHGSAFEVELPREPPSPTP